MVATPLTTSSSTPRSSAKKSYLWQQSATATRKAKYDCGFTLAAFAGPGKGTHESQIRAMPGLEVFGPTEIANKLIDAAGNKQYRDSPALAAVKLLQTAQRLSEV